MRPDQRQLRESLFDTAAIVSDLDDQQPTGREVLGRFGDDAAHEIQSVTAARKREHRFSSVFGRQRSHDRISHVRRICDDQVVATAPNARVQIGSEKAYASFK